MIRLRGPSALPAIDGTHARTRVSKSQRVISVSASGILSLPARSEREIDDRDYRAIVYLNDETSLRTVDSPAIPQIRSASRGVFCETRSRHVKCIATLAMQNTRKVARRSKCKPSPRLNINFVRVSISFSLSVSSAATRTLRCVQNIRRKYAASRKANRSDLLADLVAVH